jgi:hypothetical protein
MGDSKGSDSRGGNSSIKGRMSRKACGRDSSRGRGYSERVSDRIKGRGIEGASVGLG